MEENKLTMEELVQTEGWKNFNRKLELYTSILLAVILILWTLGLSKNNSFNMILTATLGTLTILCFFQGFSIFESESKLMSYLFYKIYGFGLAAGFMSLLFIYQKWSYPKELMAILATLLILISLVLGLRELSGENKNRINWKYFLRIFVALIPLLFYLVPKL